MAFHRSGVPTRSEIARLSAEAELCLRIQMACQAAKADRDNLKRFYILRASQEVCPQTPKEPP